MRARSKSCASGTSQRAGAPHRQAAWDGCLLWAAGRGRPLIQIRYRTTQLKRIHLPLNYGGGILEMIVAPPEHLTFACASRSAAQSTSAAFALRLVQQREPALGLAGDARRTQPKARFGIELADEQRRCFVQQAIDRRATSLGQGAHRFHSDTKVDGSRILIPGAGHAHLVLTLDDVSHALYADPMRSATFPPIRVEPEVRAEVEAVLREGETLTQFIEEAVVAAAAWRRAQAEFVKRGEDAIERWKREGGGRPADGVMADLQSRLDIAKREAARRPGR